MNSIARHIDQTLESDQQGELRNHLGASIIGRTCKRQLWYMFRWYSRPRFEGRMLRLFERGNLEESRFVKYLQKLGAIVHDTDANSRQFRVVALNEHFGGSLDAIARKIPTLERETWIVCEFKTHNDKSFKRLKASKVRIAKKEHWSQMQIYMHLTGLRTALYLAVNKNDDELYDELVQYDPFEAEQLLEKAQEIIASPRPLRRISDSPAYFDCKYCDFARICHGNAKPLQTCRSCVHSRPVELGQWQCTLWNAIIPADVAPVGCDRYEPIPDE